MSRKHGRRIFPLLLVLGIMFSACGSTSSTTFGNASGPTTIQLFFHSGQGPERDALNATLKAFSDRNPGITVEAVQLPEGRYTDQVNIAALAHSLPCLLDFDGPTLYNYAWSGYLIPLDKYVSPEMKADFLPSIFKHGYSNPKPASNADFTSGKSALSWTGHWFYLDYSNVLGDNLLVLPAPNLGKGAKTGMGSWNWGITSSCKTPDAAWKVLNFILSPNEIARMTNANGAVPARKSAIAQSKLYAPNGPLRVFVQQLQMGIAEPRPITPAYPTITSAFAEAVVNIAAGADVKEELDKAVQKIDQDIEDNQGYPTRQ